MDIIIEDYNEFIRLVKRLEKDNCELREDNGRLKAENRTLKADLQALSENSSSKFSSNNVDLLRRLSNLEKIVYGKNE